MNRKYTIIKEALDNDSSMKAYYMLSLQPDSMKRIIKGMGESAFYMKGSSQRKTMAKILIMLRKTAFKATELHGIQNLPPIEYFRQLKHDGLKLQTITYNQPDEKEKESFDIYGLSTHESHHFGNFFYRIYDFKYYQKVLELLLPLIDESGLKIKKEGFILSGDIRYQ